MAYPFQIVLEDGSVLSGYYTIYPLYVQVQAVYFDVVDKVMIEVSVAITRTILGTTFGGTAQAEIKGLGTAIVDFRVTLSTFEDFGSTALVEVNADFLPEDVIEWLCMGDPADDELRLALMAQLPLIYREVTWSHDWNNQDDEGFGDYEHSLFADHEAGGDLGEDDLNGPVVLFEDRDGSVYFLDGITWLPADALIGGLPEEPSTAPVRIDYIGRGERGLTVGEIVEEVLAKDGPISDLPADVIVAQVLAGNLDGRGSPQL